MLGRHQSASAEQTEALGAQLAAKLSRGDVVLVQGELGAGKTTFVRAACRALGVTGAVTSPTFTIAQRYAAPVPVSHVDLYRVPRLADEDPDLLVDYLGGDTIAFVESPLAGGTEPAVGEEAVAGLARIAARVRIEHAGGDCRVVEIE